MAMGPKEYMKYVEKASLLKQKVASCVTEIDALMKERASMDVTSGVIAVINEKLPKEVYEGVVKEYLKAGWYHISVSTVLIFQHEDISYTEFVFCRDKKETEEFLVSVEYREIQKWENYTQDFLK